jgi:hypothetical protein
MVKNSRTSKRRGAGKVLTPGQRGGRLGRWWLIIGASLIGHRRHRGDRVGLQMAVHAAGCHQGACRTDSPEPSRSAASAKPTFHRGAWLKGSAFLHRKRQGLPPLITVQTLIIRGSYNGLLRIHPRVDEVEVKGLHVLIPPPGPSGQPSNVMPLTTSTTGASITIGEIKTDGALLEFMPRQPGQEPFQLKVHRLTLENVGESGVIPYHAALFNSEPPGEIRSDG